MVESEYQSSRALWFAKHQPNDQGLSAPTYHVTRATRGPAARVARGDTIWLFSQLRASWGTFPPALDARLVVSDIVRSPACGSDAQPRLEFMAGDGSAWFPLCDASPTIAALRTVDAQRRPSMLLAPERAQSLGRVLQSMRELADTAPLTTLEQSIRQRGFDFISYRLMDGMRGAFEASYRLVQAGGIVWWDRWSLPRRLAERRELLNDITLETFIRGRIAASNRVFGIASPKYAELGSYSKREMDLASNMGKFWSWPGTLSQAG